MKLSRIRLKPFAGFRDREVGFEPGLNVVLGPNDVGKSSLFRAIDAALFLPTKISRSTKEGRDLLPRVLPIGGDHAELELDLAGPEGNYRLEKKWGQGAGVSLAPPTGPRLQQEEKIEETLRGLLRLPPATFQGVLFMGQGALEGTVAALQEKRESLHSLGDLLRLTVDQTAGVSVERLKALLSEKIEAAFSHWDVAAQAPEKGKGIEDPWKKGVGRVLAAFYARETVRREARLAESLEAERAARLAELNAKQAAREAAREFVKANEKFVESASARQSLESLVGKARAESEGLAKDLGAFLQAETERKLLAPDLERLEKARAALEEESRASLRAARGREIRARFEKASAARERVQAARTTLAGLPAMKPEDLRRVRAAFQEVDRLKNSLKSGKLSLQFQVKRDLPITLKKDLEAERSGKMVPGKPMTIHAGGRVHIASELFELVVTSGEGAVANLEEELGRASDALGKVLAELKVSSLEEAQERQEKYAEALLGVKGAEAGLQGALAAGESFEALEREFRALGEGAGAARDPELVQGELRGLLRELAQKREASVRSEGTLRDLERRHGVNDAAALTEKMVAKKTELLALEKKFAALPQLPETLGRLEDFLPRFQRARLEDGTLGEEIRALAVEIAELKARLPEQSAEDLTRARLEAEALFTRELAQGQALLKVAEAVKKVEGQGSDLYGGFRAAFESQVAALSAGKYQKARMQEALPEEFERQDGAPVKFSWLSAGTKDAFALALRLAMAKHFLGGAHGFLLVDDPLVNMDPARQQVAAELLREFAREQQVVVFTCHPSHAELLGGNRVEL